MNDYSFTWVRVAKDPIAIYQSEKDDLISFKQRLDENNDSLTISFIDFAIDHCEKEIALITSHIADERETI